MKILGIACSPRLGGNTEILLQQALRSAEENGCETELVRLADKTIFQCEGCRECEDTEVCKFTEDDMREILEKMLSADGIIICTPVYFWNVSGLAKTFMDRTLPVHARRRLRNKAGGAILVTARAGCSQAAGNIHNFFVLHRMLPTGVAIGYADHKGDIYGDERAIRESRGLGRAVARAAKLMQEESTGAR